MAIATTPIRTPYFPKGNIPVSFAARTHTKPRRADWPWPPSLWGCPTDRAKNPADYWRPAFPLLVALNTYGFRLKSSLKPAPPASLCLCFSALSFSLVQVICTLSGVGGACALEAAAVWDAVFLSWISWAWKSQTLAEFSGNSNSQDAPD